MESKHQSFTKLNLGDIVSSKLAYLNSKFKHHFIDIGICVKRTETDFVIIQDVFGNYSYLKVTEIDKLVKE